MRLNLSLLQATGTAALLVACSGEAPVEVDDLGYDGTGIGVTIAPLDLPSVTDACYSFDIRNGADQRVVARGRAVDSADPDGPTPEFPGVAGQGGDGGPGLTLADDGNIANPLCSNRLGNSQGAISYVAPCDASISPEGNEIHTVRLWVNSVCEAGSGFDGGCTPLEGFVNPCGAAGCAVTAACVENADVPVEFNFTIMASAQQGFFDVAVNFDNIFCSAKVDCEYDAETPISLLHHPVTGVRGQTAVVGFACTAGTGTDNTVLLRDDLVVTCDGHDPFVLDPAQPEGNVLGTAPAGSPVWQYAVYAGTEALDCGAEPCNKKYWNVAIGFDPTAPNCTLTTTATAASGLTVPGLSTPANTTYPVITVNVPLTGEDDDNAAVGVRLCTQHPLNGEPGGVETDYTPIDTPHIFSHRFDGTPFEAEEIDLLCPDGTTVWNGFYFWDSGQPMPAVDVTCIREIVGPPIVIENQADVVLVFPRLETVSSGIFLTANTNSTFSFPALREIGGNLTIQRGGYQPLPTGTVEMPVLESIATGLNIENTGDSLSVNLSSLESSGQVTVRETLLTTSSLTMPSLSSVTNVFHFEDNPLLSTPWIDALLAGLSAPAPADVIICGNLDGLPCP